MRQMHTLARQNVSLLTRRSCYLGFANNVLLTGPTILSRYKHTSNQSLKTPRAKAVPVNVGTGPRTGSLQVEDVPVKGKRSYRLWVATACLLGAVVPLVYSAIEGSESVFILDPQIFSLFTLQSKQTVSSTAGIFSLLPASSSSHERASDPYEQDWRTALWSVQIKQPQLQIVRDYTPLPPTVDPSKQSNNPQELRILIRQEKSGEMSSYLHRLPPQATLELRGPHKHFDVDPAVESVVFVAGGTGIAPALQFAYALLSTKEPASLPRMHILWACRQREDCQGGKSDTARSGGWLTTGILPQAAREADAGKEQNVIVQELEALKKRYGGRLTVDYFVDEEKSFIGKKELQRSPALPPAESKVDVTSRSKNVVLVSGPDGFVSYLAGPKTIMSGFEVQGPLGGLLKEVVREDQCTVWKL